MASQQPKRNPPIDRRLLQYAKTTKTYLVAATVLGFTQAALVITQAALLTLVITDVFIKSQSLADIKKQVVALGVVIAFRALAAWYSEVVANRCSAKAKSELRNAVIARIGSLQLSSGAAVSLISNGIDALDNYFSRYLSQLVLAAIVPALILIAVATQDWISAAIIFATLPLIPIFMILIGLKTQTHTDRQLYALQTFSAHFLDVLSGLPTLKIFGRSKAQLETISATADAFRRSTIKTLRIAFLSSLALELLASIAVALVAVSIGIRLLHGDMNLEQGLFVLILAPEAYLPLRMVGANYHASAEGLSAANQIFEILESPQREFGVAPTPDLSRTTITFEDVSVDYAGLDGHALDSFNLTITPGAVIALIGRSGCGKSTVLDALQGNVETHTGEIRIGDQQLGDLDIEDWRKNIAVVPQRPHLFAMSLSENIKLGKVDATDDELRKAIEVAGLDDVVANLPKGLETTLGNNGHGLSAGQARRVALARAVLKDAPILLLDEPTAALDGETETSIIDALGRLDNKTIVLVTHHRALLELATEIVDLDNAKVLT